MSHYFTNQDSAYTPYLFQDVILNRPYTFYGAEGVFSKNKVDFGSKTLIKALVEQGKMSGNMLDIGCGYGALSLVLTTLNPKLSAELIDVNTRAVKLAIKNIEHFKLGQRLMVSAYDLNLGAAYKDDFFDYALTNPPIRAGKSTVQKSFDLAHRSLKVGGKLYVVIQKKQGAPSAKKYIESIFGNCVIIAKSGGYYILSANRNG